MGPINPANKDTTTKAVVATLALLAGATPPIATASATSAKGNQSSELLPAARTGKTLVVSTTAAVLSGQVNARNQPTRYKFQFGPKTPYSRSTIAGEEYVVGNRTELVSEAATDLRPDTIYHFRIVAFNRYGFTVGEDRTFKTHRR
jgi:hypothetical protein